MSSDPVPDGLLAGHDSSIVSKYMRYFALEARAKDGKKYQHSDLHFCELRLAVIYAALICTLAGSLFSIFPNCSLFSTWWHYPSKPLIVCVIITCH